MRRLSMFIVPVALAAGGYWLASAPASAKSMTNNNACKPFSAWVGGEHINIVDFTASTGGASSAFRFRLKTNSVENVPGDGYFGRIVKGTMTFSYPRQNNPELPFKKGATYPASFTQGPAFGETVQYQAREIGCNVFELHWKETHKGDTVTHVEDFNREQVCTNITNINRIPIPADFDPLDLSKQLNSKDVFPNGSPVASDQFPFFNLCGRMSQSLEKNKVWETKYHSLVYADN